MPLCGPFNPWTASIWSGRFYPWLYRIIKNTCLNHLKKKKRHGETSLDKMMESGFDAREPGCGPDGMAELSGLRGAIREAMGSLSEEHREILRLRHFLELSYAEIAECLNVPQGTVMSRLHGARKALRVVLEKGQVDLAALFFGGPSRMNTVDSTGNNMHRRGGGRTVLSGAEAMAMVMNDCDKIQELITGYLDGELDAATSRLLEDHVWPVPSAGGSMTC